jgi:DNA-binding transcriptional LysR family regulator
MDLWQLKIFCKLVELKSFSKAGKAVHLTQPTVTSHIQDLEEYFGCRLIDRLSREAIPTKAGQVLYEYAQKLLALRDETENAIADFHGKIQGRLMIGGSTIPGTYLIPQIVGEFIRQYQDVTVSVTIGDTEEITDHILSGMADVGIVGAKVKDNKIEQEKFSEEDLKLVVWADHPWAGKASVSLESLIKEPFIIREHGSGTLKSVEQSLHQIGYGLGHFKIIAEMGSTAAVVQGIKNYLGVSVISTLAVSEELARGSLKALNIKGLNLKRNFYLTTCKHRSLSPVSDAFVKYLKSPAMKQIFGSRKDRQPRVSEG